MSTVFSAMSLVCRTGTDTEQSSKNTKKNESMNEQSSITLSLVVSIGSKDNSNLCLPLHFPAYLAINLALWLLLASEKWAEMTCTMEIKSKAVNNSYLFSCWKCSLNHQFQLNLTYVRLYENKKQTFFELSQRFIFWGCNYYYSYALCFFPLFTSMELHNAHHSVRPFGWQL